MCVHNKLGQVRSHLGIYLGKRVYHIRGRRVVPEYVSIMSYDSICVYVVYLNK